jgi:V-type H+-transporting ATPase subunit F
VSSSVTGLLLAGVGHVSEPPDSQRNFLIVDQKTETSQVEKAFMRFTKERKDIGILLINQHVRILGPPLRRPPYLPFSSSPLYPSRPPRCCWLTRTGIQVAEKIRDKVDSFTDAFPAILEIPSKDHPYDPDKDSVLRRVRKLFGE